MNLIRPSVLHRRRANQRGNMMLLVAMLSTVSLGLITVAFRTTDDAITTQQFQNERDLKNYVVSEVMARGAALLRTGKIPLKELRYVETYDLPDGSTFYSVVKIKLDKAPKGSPAAAVGYTIEVEPGDAKDLVKYGRRPDSLLDLGSTNPVN